MQGCKPVDLSKRQSIFFGYLDTYILRFVPGIRKFRKSSGCLYTIGFTRLYSLVRQVPYLIEEKVISLFMLVIFANRNRFLYLIQEGRYILAKNYQEPNDVIVTKLAFHDVWLGTKVQLLEVLFLLLPMRLDISES